MFITDLQDTNQNDHHAAAVRYQRNQSRLPLLHSSSLASNLILGLQDATLPYRVRLEAHLPVRLDGPFRNTIRLFLAGRGDHASNISGDWQVMYFNCLLTCNCGVFLVSHGIASTA